MNLFVASIYPEALDTLKVPVWYNPDLKILKSEVLRIITTQMFGVISKLWWEVDGAWEINFYTIDHVMRRRYSKYVIEEIYPLGEME